MSSNKNVNIIKFINDLIEEGDEDESTKSISLEKSNSKDDKNVFSSDDDQQQNKSRDSKIVDDATVDHIKCKYIPQAVSMDESIIDVLDQHKKDDSIITSDGLTFIEKSLISLNTTTNGLQSDNTDVVDSYFNDGDDQEGNDDRDATDKSLDIKDDEKPSASNKTNNSFLFTDDSYAEGNNTSILYIDENKTDPPMTIDLDAVISQQDIISVYKKCYDDQKPKKKVKAATTVSSEDLSSCHRKTNDCVCIYDYRVISAFRYENGNSRRCIPKFLENFNLISERVLLKINLTAENVYNLEVISNGILYKTIFNPNIIHPYVKDKITLTDFMDDLYAPLVQRNENENGEKEIYEIDMKKLQEIFLAPSDAQIKAENVRQCNEAKKKDNENQIEKILQVKLTDCDLFAPQQVDEKQPKDQMEDETEENNAKHGKQNKKIFNSCDVSTSTQQTHRSNHFDFASYIEKIMRNM